MPIYEFYCPDCNTIYSFLSRSVNTEKVPSCPKCDRKELQRKISRFAMVRRSGSDSAEDVDDFPVDEHKMERAMESLASEAEGLDEEDPRAAARLMRKFSDMTGLQYQGQVEEALSRMEAGEDPDAIEAEMGDALEGEENPFVMPGKHAGKRKGPPRRDEKLYDM